MKELESGEVRAVKVVEEEDFIVHDDKVDVLVAKSGMNIVTVGLVAKKHTAY